MKKFNLLSFVMLFESISMNSYSNETQTVNILQSDNYTLKEVVVLSRHNIRAPLSGKESILGKITPHEWHNWTANPSELTFKGGVLETMMGQYFRSYLEKLDFFKNGQCFTQDEVNIYANSMQRTIATAEYFKSGFSPTCDIAISHRFSPSKMDPVFFPRLTKLTPAFEQQAMKEIDSLGEGKGLYELTASLKPSFELIENVINIKNSLACKQDKICSLDDYNTQMIFKINQEPNLSGSLKLATRIADALVLQYFEEPNDKKASFGYELSTQDWEKISKVKDIYGDILFATPTISSNVAHPLLVYLKDELNSKDRKFTYLVGHDSNIGSVTKALDITDYSLPNTIEKKTPIGSKLVFEKWMDKNSEEYITIKFIYQSTEQLRNLDLLTLTNPPIIYPLKLNGLKQNDMGFYKMSDVNQRFEQAISQYEHIN